MNAPLLELILRSAVALMATAAFVVLIRLWNTPYAAQPLMRFMTIVVGMTAAWRYVVLWLGFQTDLGHWSWLVPWVQPMNAALLFLLLLATTLTAYFHARRIFKGS